MMQRKPSFPIANCSIKMPDSMPANPEPWHEEDGEQRRLQLINFGHSQWGFNNWSWSVTKQDLDFVDVAGGKYTAGVAAFVAVTVKSLDIHRENVGYATCAAASKGSAIWKSRKGAVTNALRETLLSFGGAAAAELAELGAEPAPAPAPAPAAEPRAPAPAAEPRAPAAAADPRACKPVEPVARPPAPPVAAALPMPARAARPPSNEAREGSSSAGAREGSSSAEARAERKRRQRQAQEEFRLKQLLKQKTNDEKPEPEKNTSSFDKLLMEIPTQDIVIEQSGAGGQDAGKRKSPAPDTSSKRRTSNMSRLDIVSTD